jgi:MoxR-like ATPase
MERQGTDELRSDDLEAVRKLKDAFGSIKSQLSRIIVGQEEVIEELLISLFASGHCMLEGVPGLAKTLMISTLARRCRWPSHASSSRPT